jgi:hypothetical protein
LLLFVVLLLLFTGMERIFPAGFTGCFTGEVEAVVVAVGGALLLVCGVVTVSLMALSRGSEGVMGCTSIIAATSALVVGIRMLVALALASMTCRRYCSSSVRICFDRRSSGGLTNK